MAKIKVKTLTDNKGENFYPLTHGTAVVNDQGVNMEDRMTHVEDTVEQKSKEQAEFFEATDARVSETEGQVAQFESSVAQEVADLKQAQNEFYTTTNTRVQSFEDDVEARLAEKAKIGVVDETGDSNEYVMSQAAVTRELTELESRTEMLEEDQQLIRDTMAQNKRELKTDVAETKQRIEQVAVAVEEIEQTVINGDVTNAPDEEDLTTGEDNRLKFKDRPALSGMGYVILRKNFVEGKNTLTQEMVNQENTIYEIRYDFDLNDEEITIPEGCVLDFQGGSFSNGTINANGCELKGTPKLNVSKIGMLKYGYYDLSWFVGIEDYSTLLQDVLDKSYTGLHKNEQIIIYVPKGEYIISNLTWANPNTGSPNTNNRFAGRLTIRGEGTGSVININSGDGITLIDRFLIEDVVIIGAKVKPAIKLGKTSTIYPDANSIINRCHFENNNAGAITSVDYLLNLNITNCYFTSNNNKEGSVVSLQGQSSTTFRVTKCYFSNNNSAKYCLYLEGNTNINIHDNIFESSGLLIYAHSCNMLSVDSNYFEYGTDYYVQVDKHSFVVHITNNLFRYNMCDKPFISLSNSGEKVVENNKFEWWGLGNIPNEGYIKGINITNLRYNNNSLSVKNPQTTRFENEGDADINISTRNLKLYSSFQNGTSETGYPKATDSDNYIEFVNDYGYADNNSYKVRLTSKLLRVPNTNYTYKAGDRYVVSFYLKFTEESKDNTVEVLFTGAAGIGDAIISDKSTDWKRYQFEILQDEGNVDVGIYFKPYTYATGACEFYIDDVQIERKESGFAGDYILTNNISLPYTKNNLAISPNLFNTSFKVEGEGWYRVLKLNYVPALLSLYVYKSYTSSPFECQVINIGCRYNNSHSAYSMFGSVFTKFRITQVGDIYYLELYYNNNFVNDISIVIDNYITFEKCTIIPVIKDAEYDTMIYSGIIAQSITQSGTSSNRPTNINNGYQYFDANINKPIWWTGSKWVDATGAEV